MGVSVSVQDVMNRYSMGPQRHFLVWAWIVMMMVALPGSGTTVRAEEGPPQQAGLQGYSKCGPSLPSASSRSELEGIQVESSDIGLYELFFSQVLHADEVQRIDHPQIDFIRGYCYRNVLIVVRQDVKTPRPTGWIQVNFAVADVGDVRKHIEHALLESHVAKLDDAERAKIARLRFKPDVSRNNCRVDRLEVSGPEGFMMGFDQFKEGSCKRADDRPQKENREPNRPHH
jgi:hypothetical protein